MHLLDLNATAANELYLQSVYDVFPKFKLCNLSPGTFCFIWMMAHALEMFRRFMWREKYTEKYILAMIEMQLFLAQRI